jgi:hypothetical protein
MVVIRDRWAPSLGLLQQYLNKSTEPFNPSLSIVSEPVNWFISCPGITGVDSQALVRDMDMHGRYLGYVPQHLAL